MLADRRGRNVAVTVGQNRVHTLLLLIVTLRDCSVLGIAGGEPVCCGEG
jgi:hypothetical protein